MGNTTVATADYGTVLTAIGASKIASCILNGTKLNITHAAVGDGGGYYYKPTGEETGLKNECWRGEIAYYKINEANSNMLDVKFVVPAEVGGFTIREAMLIDEDGDVFAICNTPDAQKVAITDGVSFPVTMLMHIVVTDASAVQVIVNATLDTVSREELDDELARFAADVGSAITREITIPVSGWVPFSSSEPGFKKYKYSIDVALEESTEKHFPTMAISIPSEDAAALAGLCATIETLDGFVRFWSKMIPSQDITGVIQLRSENLAHNGDVATDEEVNDAVDDIFGDTSAAVPTGVTVATDEDVQDMLDSVFAQKS